jgi:hypothetical protein
VASGNMAASDVVYQRRFPVGHPGPVASVNCIERQPLYHVADDRRCNHLAYKLRYRNTLGANRFSVSLVDRLSDIRGAAIVAAFISASKTRYTTLFRRIASGDRRVSRYGGRRSQRAGDFVREFAPDRADGAHDNDRSPKLRPRITASLAFAVAHVSHSLATAASVSETPNDAPDPSNSSFPLLGWVVTVDQGRQLTVQHGAYVEVDRNFFEGSWAGILIEHRKRSDFCLHLTVIAPGGAGAAVGIERCGKVRGRGAAGAAGGLGQA